MIESELEPKPWLKIGVKNHALNLVRAKKKAQNDEAVRALVELLKKILDINVHETSEPDTFAEGPTTPEWRDSGLVFTLGVDDDLFTPILVVARADYPGDKVQVISWDDLGETLLAWGFK